MIRLVSPGPLPGWLLALQGGGHHPRCWALGSGSCAHHSPAPRPTRGLPGAPPRPARRTAAGGTAPRGSAGGRSRAEGFPPRARRPRAHARTEGREQGLDPARKTKPRRRHDVRAGGAAGASALAGRGVLSARFRAPWAQGAGHMVQGWPTGRSPRGAVSGAPQRGLGRGGRAGRAGCGTCVPRGTCVPAGPPLPEAPVSVLRQPRPRAAPPAGRARPGASWRGAPATLRRPRRP